MNTVTTTSIHFMWLSMACLPLHSQNSPFRHVQSVPYICCVPHPSHQLLHQPNCEHAIVCWQKRWSHLMDTYSSWKGMKVNTIKEHIQNMAVQLKWSHQIVSNSIYQTYLLFQITNRNWLPVCCASGCRNGRKPTQRLVVIWWIQYLIVDWWLPLSSAHIDETELLPLIIMLDITFGLDTNILFFSWDLPTSTKPTALQKIGDYTSRYDIWCSPPPMKI